MAERTGWIKSPRRCGTLPRSRERTFGEEYRMSVRRGRFILRLMMGFGLLGWLGTGSQAQNPSRAGGDSLDPTVLPIPEPQTPPITVLDVRNAKAPPRFEVKAPG